MRVMVLVKATDDSESGTLPSAEMMEAMGRFMASCGPSSTAQKETRTCA